MWYVIKSEVFKVIYEDIEYSIELILKQFQKIESSDDFLFDENGLEKSNAISMRLVAIGEGFKNIDKLTNNKFLPYYPSINWKGIKGVRDILSHHYFDLDAKTIFMICDHYMFDLLTVTGR